MDNETKYPLIIIGVALIALIAFNYNDLLTGGIVIKTAPTTFSQERLNLIREINVPERIKGGQQIDIVFSSIGNNDLIQINKEKILIYSVNGDVVRMKRQLTYPRCTDGISTACYMAEEPFSIPVSWGPGKYKIQIERGGSVGEKAVTEVLGRVFFNIV